MPQKKMTKKNADKVLAAIGKSIKTDKNDGPVYLERLNRMLDDLTTEDFFGTEGQTDPRGDQRA